MFSNNHLVILSNRNCSGWTYHVMGLRFCGGFCCGFGGSLSAVFVRCLLVCFSVFRRLCCLPLGGLRRFFCGGVFVFFWGGFRCVWMCEGAYGFGERGFAGGSDVWIGDSRFCYQIFWVWFEVCFRIWCVFDEIWFLLDSSFQKLFLILWCVGFSERQFWNLLSNFSEIWIYEVLLGNEGWIRV